MPRFARLSRGALGAIAVTALLAPAAVLAQHGGGGHPMPGVILDPMSIPKYQDALVIPPVMPPAKARRPDDFERDDRSRDDRQRPVEYTIALRQFQQQILPAGLPATTVWSYGNPEVPGSFNYPAFTIEARWKKPVRVRWANELVKDPAGCFHRAPGARPDACNALPHLLPVDPTLHWANPPGDCMEPMRNRDCRGMDPAPYAGPVPMVVHVHGAETSEDSDGYPEAWYLPAADDIPAGYSTTGSFYDTFKAASPNRLKWKRGSAVFQYPNDQPATTLWYHDHTLGMTRQNVYAGPAGFYLLRGGPGDAIGGTLPGPAPALGDRPGTRYYEIPIAIQDRTFEVDGGLFYPDNRAFFEGLAAHQLQIPFIPQDAVYPGGTNLGASDVAPIWNPEFFGNAIVVNGKTWPYLNVEPRRYRLRLLNGSQSRFLILEIGDGETFWQIGGDQGFLPAPVPLQRLLLAPAERADVIVDFTGKAAGTTITLRNLGPDEPFGGGEPGVDFPPADPMTTGQVMEFRVVPLQGWDRSTPPALLRLPAPPALGPGVATRRLSLNELDSATVRVVNDLDGNVVLDLGGDPFGPTAALLGTVNADGTVSPLEWMDPTTENVSRPGDVEVWEIYNYTADAHPIHIHLVQFLVVDRQGLAFDAEGRPLALPVGAPAPPEAWETGYKDTVIAYPGEVTRVRAKFERPGLFVWHCHILEHEDNEMMRPYCVGNTAACRQHNSTTHPH
jgi:bilirubin oxidase